MPKKTYTVLFHVPADSADEALELIRTSSPFIFNDGSKEQVGSPSIITEGERWLEPLYTY